MNSRPNLSALNNLKPIVENGKSNIFLYKMSSGKLVIIKRAMHSHLKYEYEVLSNLFHPNIIKVFDYGHSVIKWHHMISEFCENGDMYDFLTKYYRKITISSDVEKFWNSVFTSLLKALLYMKSRNLAHLDIKPENILISANYEIKLCDFEFAFSTVSSDGKPLLCSFNGGTEINYSPEICEEKFPYDPHKSDVFSLAITMINMICGIKVFMRKPMIEPLYKFIKNNKFNDFWKNIKRSQILSKSFKDLLEKMLKYDPNERISLEEIEKHEWMKIPSLSQSEIKQLLL